MQIGNPGPQPVALWPVGTLGLRLPIYAWRIFTSPTQSLTSDTEGKSFANVPASVYGCIWYHLPPYKDDVYGDVTPTFQLPDGTTRNRSNMNANAYQTLVNNMWGAAADTWPTITYV